MELFHLVNLQKIFKKPRLKTWLAVSIENATALQLYTENFQQKCGFSTLQMKTI